MFELHVGEWMVLASILAMSVYSIFESDKSKKAVLAGRKTKLRMYQETMLFMWLPTSVLLYLLGTQIIAPGDIGLHWQSSIANWSGIALVLVAMLYLGWSISSVLRNKEQLQQARCACQSHSWMLPATRRELSWFTAGVSVSAGICEELLFRGFLLYVLSDQIGVIAGLIVSSVLFGICHLYQGWAGVLRTGVVGLILGVIYVLTESLLIVIVLHALADIYGGVLGYLVNKLDDENADCRATAS